MDAITVGDILRFVVFFLGVYIVSFITLILFAIHFENKRRK